MYLFAVPHLVPDNVAACRILALIASRSSRALSVGRREGIRLNLTCMEKAVTSLLAAETSYSNVMDNAIGPLGSIAAIGP